MDELDLDNESSLNMEDSLSEHFENPLPLKHLSLIVVLPPVGRYYCLTSALPTTRL